MMLDIKPERNTDIEYARDIRKKRSEIKSDLKAGRINLSKLFEDEKTYKKYIANMKAVEILNALPGIGPVKAEKILKTMDISLCKKIRGLGKNQKKKFNQYFNIQDL
jgi:hypothetical protein